MHAPAEWQTSVGEARQKSIHPSLDWLVVRSVIVHGGNDALVKDGDSRRKRPGVGA